MREVLRAVVQNLCQKLPGMTDPLSTQLPPSGNVPPSKKLKLDSVSDGAGEPCWRFARFAGEKGCKPFAERRAFPDWGLPNRPRLLSCFTRATAVVRSAFRCVFEPSSARCQFRRGCVSCMFRVCAAKKLATLPQRCSEAVMSHKHTLFFVFARHLLSPFPSHTPPFAV